MSPTWFPVVISVLLLLALVLQAAQTWLGFQLRRERLEISWEVQHVDDVERAWGIIANAMDWVESPEWQRAADSFRDDVWHPMLGPGPSPKRHGFLRRGVRFRAGGPGARPLVPPGPDAEGPGAALSDGAGIPDHDGESPHTTLEWD